MSGVLAVEMMTKIFGIHGAPQVVHADRGTSMTSKTVAALLADLEVTRSHSRPRVSNDNPYSDYAGDVIMPSWGADGHVCADQDAVAV
jgi:putative transposase